MVLWGGWDRAWSRTRQRRFGGLVDCVLDVFDGRAAAWEDTFQANWNSSTWRPSSRSGWNCSGRSRKSFCPLLNRVSWSGLLENPMSNFRRNLRNSLNRSRTWRSLEGASYQRSPGGVQPATRLPRCTRTWVGKKLKNLTRIDGLCVRSSSPYFVSASCLAWVKMTRPFVPVRPFCKSFWQIPCSKRQGLSERHSSLGHGMSMNFTDLEKTCWSIECSTIFRLTAVAHVVGEENRCYRKKIDC